MLEESKISPNRIPGSGHANSPQLVSRDCASTAIWLTWVAAALLVLLVARSLQPNTSGFGTHTQLGLPGCLFMHWTGLPCPACGLTTTFSLLAHGSLRAGVACHPVGALLFTLTCLSVPFGVGALLADVSVARALSHLQARRVCVALAGALLLQWFMSLAHVVLAH
jgi:hypothetical protein